MIDGETMFPQPELSSNLEWLLQSPQSAPESLALALWETCGSHVACLGAALFGEAQALPFVTQVVSGCLLVAEAYRAELPPCNWVMRVALQTARRLADAPTVQVEARFLGAARQLGYEREVLLTLWDGDRRRFEHAWQEIPAKEGETEPPLGWRVPPRVSAPPERGDVSDVSGGARPPQVDPPPEDFPLPDFLQRAVWQAGLLQARRTRRFRLVESLVVVFFVAFLLIGMRIGQALDPHHNQATVVTQVVVVQVTPSPVMVTVIPTPVAQGAQEAYLPVSTPAPLESLDLMQVVALLQRSTSFWQTLWVDAFVLDYGPEGYTGPPNIIRQQVWLFGDDRLLLLSGSPYGLPDVWLHVGADDFYKVLSSSSTELTVDSRLEEMLHPAGLLEEMPALRVVGLEDVFGRPALHLEAMRTGGVREGWWIDRQYGILLWRQIFDRRGVLRYEVQISNLAFNFKPREEMFSEEILSYRVFAASPFGEKEKLGARPQLIVDPLAAGHVPATRLTPPPDFDPTDAVLTFEWNAQPTWRGEAASMPVDVRLLGDGYYLGIIQIPIEHLVTCVRNAEGEMFIVYSNYDDKNGPLSPIWDNYRLRDFDAGYANDYAMGRSMWKDRSEVIDPAGEDTFLQVRPAVLVARDGKTFYLAADSTIDGMGIYRVRQEKHSWNWTLEAERLFNAFHTGPLALSPSGTQLAWLEYRDTDTWELVIADLQSETILSRQTVNIRMAADGLPVSVPTVWGKPFPWPQPGLLNCALPPAAP